MIYASIMQCPTATNVLGRPEPQSTHRRIMARASDQDQGKGAEEQDHDNQGGNTSMQGQLGHRDQDELLKDADLHSL